MEMINAVNLKKYYITDTYEVHALDGVSLSAEDGEFLAIIGTSGSGILHLIRRYMEERLSYFQYQYPSVWTLVLLAGLTGICLMVPEIIWRVPFQGNDPEGGCSRCSPVP